MARTSIFSQEIAGSAFCYPLFPVGNLYHATLLYPCRGVYGRSQSKFLFFHLAVRHSLFQVSYCVWVSIKNFRE
ncbi:hypothetical protein B0T09DRAFT_345255 [Sordaria sp. MPI-SDFR-AT-0083]|nr:hypothetical protein B0T09DRAFT_345255 [Sordaria sp. MPI-SDFR-AT-0083]